MNTSILINNNLVYFVSYEKKKTFFLRMRAS